MILCVRESCWNRDPLCSWSPCWWHCSTATRMVLLIMHSAVWSVPYCILLSAFAGKYTEYNQAVFGAAGYIPSCELCAVNTVVGQLADWIIHPQIASYLKRILPIGSTRTSLSDTSSGSMSPVMHCAMTSLHYMQWNSFRQSVILSLGCRKSLLTVNLHYATWPDLLKPGNSIRYGKGRIFFITHSGDDTS